jgi:neutral ceramidase
MGLGTALRREISRSAADTKRWAASDEGLRSSKLLRGFATAGSEPTAVFELERTQKLAGHVLEHGLKLPEGLAAHADAPLLKVEGLKGTRLSNQLGAGLLTLDAQARAVMLAGKELDKRFADNAVQLAFGGDAASAALRGTLVDTKRPVWPKGSEGLLDSLDQWVDAGRLKELVTGGALRDLLRQFAVCGLAAQEDRDWVNAAQAFGSIRNLVPARACAGSTLRVSFSGFGANPPAQDTQLWFGLPTRSGTSWQPLRDLAPQLFAPGGWRDSGSFDVVLPSAIYSGPLGFLLLPPPRAGSPCGAGGLLGAAQQWQSVLGDAFGPAGVLSAQGVVQVAQKVEAARHRPLPPAQPQPDGANLLLAGPAYIDQFLVVEQGPVFPRGTVTLSWSVANADSVEILAEDEPGSENPHQLPALPGPLAAMGRVTLNVNCTRRWEGRYRLRARNANGCTGDPAEATVSLRSGFSHYRLGVAKADITDRRPGLPMAGFAYERQKAQGVESPIYARAFAIQENKSSGRSLTLVVADIWTCTLKLKREVLRRLNQASPQQPPRYTHANLLISGTHTHAAPGGYSEYFLYNLSIGGFEQGVFDKLASGIVQAVQSANLNASPGRLYVTEGQVDDCGVNRSLEAFQRNPEYNPADPGSWTDRDMLLLSFYEDENNRGKTVPIGCLNWYAIHPTALGMFNDQISGDCKGHAEAVMEGELNHRVGGWRSFVAAFGNGNAGDVSGNMSLDARGNKLVERPMGGDAPAAPITILPAPRHPSNREQDFKRMRQLGQIQAQRALALFDGPRTELSGALSAAHCFIDMSAVPITARPGERTWPATLGVSFGAGSSEDSIAYASMGPLDVDANILEGMTHVEHTAGGVEFWASAALFLGPHLPAIVGALASGVPPVASVAGGALSTIAVVALLDHARSYGAALVGGMAFDGKVTECAPQWEARLGSWTWLPAPVPSAALRTGQGDKPIMFNVGEWKLRFARGPMPSAEPAEGDHLCPLVPHVLPLHLLNIGGVVLAGVPAEFTGMAGRRLKASLRQALGAKLSHVAIANYSNGYSGYVTTREEYGAQHYEGASTLYGPATLEAYQQSFEALAARLHGQASGPMPSESQEFEVPAIYMRP